MSLTVTFYIPPNGKKEVRKITNYKKEDAEFFIKNNVKISMEDLGSQYAIYGLIDGEPEENEFIVLSSGRSCEDCLTELRGILEKYLTNIKK